MTDIGLGFRRSLDETWRQATERIAKRPYGPWDTKTKQKTLNQVGLGI